MSLSVVSTNLNRSGGVRLDPLAKIFLGWVLTGLVAQILSGCAIFQRQSFIQDTFDASSAVLPFKLGRVVVKDTREGVDRRPLKSPVWALPGTEDKVSPTLREKDAQLIRDEIARYFQPSGKKVHVQADVERGVQGFENHWISGKEKVDVAITITLIDAQTGTVMGKAQGSMEASVTSSYQTRAYTQALYDKCIRHSLFKSMEYFRKELVPPPTPSNVRPFKT